MRKARLPGGLELAYDDMGSGPALLLIHGWPHNHSLWAGQSSGLSIQCRCVAPDLRGFGGSTTKAPYSMVQYADDLVALLDALAIADAVVCGLSMGGYVAFAMVRRHRARIRALVLTATRATVDTPAARENRERLIELSERRGMDALAEHQLRGMLSPSTFESRHDVRELLRRMMASASRDGAIGGQRAMMARDDSSDLLRTMDLPTLVVAGADDTLTPPDEQRALAAAIPGSRFERLANAGHVSALERPAAFNHVVGEFLAGLRRD